MTEATNELARSKVSTRRVAIFLGVCVGAVTLATGALVLARRNHDQAVRNAPPVAVAETDGGMSIEPGLPILLFESKAIGDTYGRLSSVPVGDPTGARTVSDLHCERVHFSGGTGVCLQADRGFITTYKAIVFDDKLQETHEIGLAGEPSRVRVSPDGSLAGITVFVNGHSYSDVGFSTQTTLNDLVTGDVVADLEVDFTVLRDGEQWQEVDFNFWGVTFVDDHTFYATLGSGGETYLVQGDVDARTMTILEVGIECPSLSPDGTRVAFKSRGQDTNGAAAWRIAVLDLATSEVTMLSEPRSVDDQVAWLDDDTIMYGLPNADSPAESDTWVVPADGSGEPTMFLGRAWSTSVVA